MTKLQKNIKEHNPNWPEIPDHPYRILIVLIRHEPDIDQIYLYAKDPYEAKYQFLINKKESAGLKYLNDSKAFVEHSNNMGIFIKKILKNTVQIKNELF